jgi:integrase
VSRSEPVYKRCKCQGPDGKELGADCPDLHRKDGSWNPHHGSWYFALELPLGPGGQRRPRMRRGGFASRDAAAAEREKERQKIREGVDPSVRMKTGTYLAQWLAGRLDLKPSTRHNYTVSINTYWIPLIGHIELRDLQQLHISQAFATIREWNEQLADGRPVRPFQRHVGPAAMQRIRNVLRTALRDAVRARLVGFNAAEHVPMESAPSYNPEVWTAARIRRFWFDYEEALDQATRDRGDRPFLVWRSMALRPFPVMVWTMEDLGAFLDYAAGHRLSPLFELAAGTGMRRGELAGLPWTNVDLDNAMIHVTTAAVQAGWQVVRGGPKTDAGHRRVPLVAQDVATLKTWKAKQDAERLRWGTDWHDTGLVFTQEDGTAWHPDSITDAFERQAFAAHLPPVRLHDVRHAHIGEMLALGVSERIIADRVGHSGTQMTRDYAAVAEHVSRDAAERVVSAIPRRARR